MLKANQKSLTGVLFSAGLLLANSASSAVLEPGVGVGFEYTDNAGLADSNEDSDLILLGYAGGKFDKSTGRLQARGVASLVYQEYTDNTFSDQYYWDVDATVSWAQIRQRLDWVVQNKFTQRQVDALAADTPDNSQDTNIFSFGPNITLPISGRQTLNINPSYRKFYYEESSADNQEYSLSLAWLHKLRPTLQIGLDGSVSKSEFDNERQNPNFVSSTLQAVVVGKQSRSDYTLAAGVDYIQRDDVSDQDGFAGSLDWVTKLTGVSNVRLYLASSLTDSSADAFDAATNPGRGDVNNVQIDGDVFRDYIGRTEYLGSTPTIKSRLWLELRKLNYKESLNDREVQEVGLELSRLMTQKLTAGLYGSFNRVEETDIDRTDKTYLAGGDVVFQMTNKLRVIANLQYQTRDSDIDTEDYDEVSSFIGIVYGYGDVERTRGTNSLPR